MRGIVVGADGTFVSTDRSFGEVNLLLLSPCLTFKHVDINLEGNCGGWRIIVFGLLPQYQKVEEEDLMTLMMHVTF